MMAVAGNRSNQSPHLPAAHNPPVKSIGEGPKTFLHSRKWRHKDESYKMEGISRGWTFPSTNCSDWSIHTWKISHLTGFEMPMPIPCLLGLLLLGQVLGLQMSSPSPSTASSNGVVDPLQGDIPSNSTDTTAPPTAQLAKPPPSTRAEETTRPGPGPDGQKEEEKQQTKKAPIVARQSPSMPAGPDATPFAPLKPESKDEMFARIDSDGDNAISLQDYMNRDRYYLESVRTEFNDIDTNRDGKVTKGEFDAFVQRLDEQRKAAMLNASNFTLQKNDVNNDGELGLDELSAYINGTLQRSVAKLPEVFRQFDKDENQRLDLDEFHELDFNFPWDKFPPQNEQMPSSNRQVFFNANVPIPPPFVNDQAGAAPMPPVLPPGPNAGGGYGSSVRLPPMPIPQPVRLRWTF